MSFLQQCTNEQLVYLLKCKKLKAIREIVDEDVAEEFLSLLARQHPQRRSRNKILRALAVPLTDVSDYPLIVLWSVIGVISLGILPLVIGTSILAIMSLIIGCLFVYSNYTEIEKTEDTLNKALRFYDFKNQVADEILTRNNLKIKLTKQPSYPNKNFLPLFKESVGTAMLISTPLCSAYFLALNVVITTFHLTVAASFMTGPFGLVLGLLPAMAIGIYFGYIHFMASKQDDVYQFEKKSANTIIKKKIQLCKRLALTDKADTPLIHNKLHSKHKFTLKVKPGQTPIAANDNSENAQSPVIKIGF